MTNPNTAPLAQDFVTAAQVPDPQRYFFHDPDLTRLDDGTLIIAAPQWGRRDHRNLGRQLRLLRSDDGGASWEDLPTLPYEEGMVFVLDGQLYLFAQKEFHRDILIATSPDRGHTWSDPVRVIEGPIWNISTAMLQRRDYTYWAMDWDLPDLTHGGKVMVRIDRRRSLLDPAAWELSNIVEPPPLPDSLTRQLFPPENPLNFRWPNNFVWLEPNTVEVGGQIRVFTRCVIDQYATANLAAALDYDPDTNQLRFTQFAGWPGAQCKFFIISDPQSRTYWMLSNLVTNSQDLLGWGGRMEQSGYHGAAGNERRWLFLHYSIDCLNWFPAGCVARWPDHANRSFMYPSAVTDGDDLVILSRTSRDSGDQHDADLCTIHRVPNFRALALDLHRGGLA